MEVGNIHVTSSHSGKFSGSAKGTLFFLLSCILNFLIKSSSFYPFNLEYYFGVYIDHIYGKFLLASLTLHV